jgi:hypothetical protein
MAQLKRVSDPFGEVHVYPSDNGHVRVVATIKPEGPDTALSGKILDSAGRTLLDFTGTGLPSKIEFLVPLGTSHCTLDLGNKQIHQPLSDESAIPTPQAIGGTPGTLKAAAPVAPSVVPIMIQHKAERKMRSADLDESPQTIPLWKLKLELESQREESTDFDLDVEKKVSDIDPDSHDGNKK